MYAPYISWHSAKAAARPAGPRLYCPSFSIGALAPGVDLTKPNQLAASLEDDLLIEKVRQGR
jgi:hypothetical protein